MKSFKIMTLTMTLFLSHNVTAAEIEKQPEFTHAELKAQAAQFFQIYLNTYNKRFNHPEKANDFINELSQLINEPFIMSPPKGKPFYPQTPELMTRAFDGFVQNLEQKGVTELIWKEVNFHVLTQNKILANNVGHGIDKDGKVVYETVSVYLINRDNNQWKISVFSPYTINNKLSF